MPKPEVSNHGPPIVSPNFVNLGEQSRSELLNTDATAQYGHSGKTGGSIQRSSSPPTSVTKSIMNVSGTSGAVISNTPASGLKRVPTVTFTDAKHAILKQQAATESMAGGANGINSPGKTGSPCCSDHAPSPPPMELFLNGKSGTGNSNDWNVKPASPILKVKENTKKQYRLPSQSSEVDGSIINNLLDVTLSAGIPAKVGEELNTISSSTSNNEDGIHPHFVVNDELHSPTFKSRSRSNSISPVPNPNNPLVPSTSKLNEVAIPENDQLGSSEVQLDIAQTVAPNIPKREAAKNVDPRLPQDDGKLHILFGATGSLSVLKIKSMIKKLEEIYGKDKVSIQVILTQAAAQFFANRTLNKKKAVSPSAQLQHIHTPMTSSPQPHDHISSPPESIAGLLSGTDPNGVYTAAKIELPPHIQVWTDQDEWDTWKQRTDPVLHIELRRWADILVVAPLTANTLSKIALGLCDNLLTSVIRAWNPVFPIFLAPSMVSSSYNSSITKRHLNMIKEEMPWITVFKPSEKIVGIYGEMGLGGMMDGNEIVDKVVMKLGGYPKDEIQEVDDEEDDDEDDDEENGDDQKKGKKTEDEDEDEDDDEDDDEDEDEDDDEDEDEDDDENYKNSDLDTKSGIEK